MVEAKRQGYKKLIDLFYEQKIIELEICKTKSDNIETRLLEIDRLQESQTEKELELAQLEADFQMLAGHLTRIKILVEGKNTDELAPATIKAYERISKSFSFLDGARKKLEEELSEITSRVSDQEVRRYRELVWRQDDIRNDICELEIILELRRQNG